MEPPVTTGSRLGLVSRYGMRTDEFQELMSFRVRRILLVASPYDTFVLEEDGQLTEQIVEEYRNLDLNLRFAPNFTPAATGGEALQLLSEQGFELIISSAHLGDMDLEEFARRVQSEYAGTPLAILAPHAWDLPALESMREKQLAKWVFLWQGDVMLLLAIIKQVEDLHNARHDVLEGGVQVILLVEDEVKFFSSFLPQMYSEVMQQTTRLLSEGLNLAHRLLRMRARPKILLAQTYEEAWAFFEKYRDNILGIISDVHFKRAGKPDPEAGLAFARKVRGVDADIPILLQSSERDVATKAHASGASFLPKDAPQLLTQIRQYILENFGFGEFIFRMPGGEEIGSVHSLRDMLPLLDEIPDKSIQYHAERNHFSRWLKARCEFELASLVRSQQVSDFPSIKALRKHLAGTIATYLRAIKRHVITDFEAQRYDEFVAFARIGTGSLGGKGRGLAFMHKFLAQQRIDIEGVELAIPQTVALASDVFEEIVESGGVKSKVLNSGKITDRQILNEFRCIRFPDAIVADLAAFLQAMREPIAVRSSSLFEDSLYQPFAGVYATIMLPNNHSSLDVRLAQLLEAIKVVYASTYFQAAREYVDSTAHRVEEERMAVLIQRLVGNRRDDYFYPLVSGLASSHNFYPFGEMKSEEGVVLMALGLGKTVVEGYDALRFCPAHPEVLPHFSNVKDILRNAQRKFYALDMANEDVIPDLQIDANLLHLDVAEATKYAGADPAFSTFLPRNDSVVPGCRSEGTPLVTFSYLRKGSPIALPDLMKRLLDIGQRGVGVPIEIEFALELHQRGKARQVLHVLQVRPMLVEKIEEELAEDLSSLDEALVYSERALGHGRAAELRDIICVTPSRLDRAQTWAVSELVARMNQKLRQQDRNYLLIGPGRWGSNDQWLGIPVVWSQISAARAIVEADFADLEVEPSQGSHFFHNLTNFGIAYFTAHPRYGKERIDWDWLEQQPAVEECLGGCVRHIALERPLQILVDGRSGQGAILRGQAV